MNFIEWLQEIVLSVGMIMAFVLILYYRYPKISSGLNKIFKLKSKKKGKNIKSSDEEIMFLIRGYMLAYKNKKYTAKEVIEKIKKVVS